MQEVRHAKCTPNVEMNATGSKQSLTSEGRESQSPPHIKAVANVKDTQLAKARVLSMSEWSWVSAIKIAKASPLHIKAVTDVSDTRHES